LFPDALACLRRNGSQRRQSAVAIVDVRDLRAARIAPFQPVVRAPIDLDRLANPVPALTQLKPAPRPPPLGLPKPRPIRDWRNVSARITIPSCSNSFSAAKSAPKS